MYTALLFVVGKRRRQFISSIYHNELRLNSTTHNQTYKMLHITIVQRHRQKLQP